MTVVTLPWPNGVLNPNNRKHWRTKAAAKAKARAEAILLAGQPPGEAETMHLFITFHPPSKRHYDLDNLLASMKSALDGIAEKWGINDKCFRPITIDFGEVRKQGEVVVEVIGA